MAPPRSQGPEWRDLVTIVAGALCAAAGMGVIVAVVAWSSLCSEGTFERCMNGDPSFELVFQFVLACAGLAVTVVMWVLARRGSYRPATAMFVIAVVVFGAWAVFLDAATHGWDDLKLLWLG